MKKIKVLKKPGQGKIASKKDFKAKEVNIPDHEFHAKEKKKEDKEDKNKLNILSEMRETISNTEYTFSRLSQYHEILKNTL